MKQRPRIYYTEEQKAMMWDRWQKGETLGSIARLFDRHHPSIERRNGRSKIIHAVTFNIILEKHKFKTAKFFSNRFENSNGLFIISR